MSNLPVGDDADDGHEGVGGEEEIVDQVAKQDTCLKECVAHFFILQAYCTSCLNGLKESRSNIPLSTS